MNGSIGLLSKPVSILSWFFVVFMANVPIALNPDSDIRLDVFHNTCFMYIILLQYSSMHTYEPMNLTFLFFRCIGVEMRPKTVIQFGQITKKRHNAVALLLHFLILSRPLWEI